MLLHREGAGLHTGHGLLFVLEVLPGCLQQLCRLLPGDHYDAVPVAHQNITGHDHLSAADHRHIHLARSLTVGPQRAYRLAIDRQAAVLDILQVPHRPVYHKAAQTPHLGIGQHHAAHHTAVGIARSVNDDDVPGTGIVQRRLCHQVIPRRHPHGKGSAHQRQVIERTDAVKHAVHPLGTVPDVAAGDSPECLYQFRGRTLKLLIRTKSNGHTVLPFLRHAGSAVSRRPVCPAVHAGLSGVRNASFPAIRLAAGFFLSL